ncbi:hypothetical protein D9M69_501630 [compost metagenome]
MISTNPTRIDARPTVTMNTEIGGSPSSGRIMVRSITAPSRPVPITEPSTAIQIGSEKLAAKVKNR